MIRFPGRGSAFADTHNSALFSCGDELVLIDCPMGAFHIIKKMDLSRYNRISILVTHTHSDHIGGIAMLVDFEYFIGHKEVTVIAPNKEVKANLKYFLNNLDGCEDGWYNLIDVSELRADWFIEAIPTQHVSGLEGKCYGYLLSDNGDRFVYTGDTRTIEPFKPYLEKGTTLYMEISSHQSNVHLYAPDMIGFINEYTAKGIRIYLMHIDDEQMVREMLKGTKTEFAPLLGDTETKEVWSMTESDNRALEEIYNISDKLYNEMCSNKENDHATLFSYLTELGKTIVGADRASFWKWDKRRGELWTQSATGVDKIVIPDTTGLVGKAMQSGSVIITNDPYSDPAFNQEVDKKTGYITRSVLVLPVADVYGNFIGAFQLINKLPEGSKFNEDEDVHKLSLPALICGIALESETFLEDSHHDKLTKLKNRMGFYNDFSRRFNSYLEDGCDRPLSMFICDIDKFKRVNDTYGHNAGDDVLAFCASLIQGACTEKDSAYRWGGEEFIMIMTDTALEEAVAKAEELRKKVEESDFPADGNTIHCTLSFGVRQFDPSMTIEENISVADGHLYTAKETGRNRVIYQ